MRGVKRVFPGGNTSEGFFSYYQYLLEKGTKKIFVIKGGPGVGKSTLMKKVAKTMSDLGYDVEYHHCSSDNHSLDGIAVLETGIVMVDGTAPHIIDPKFPGGVDEIINLGEYWDAEALELNKDKIIASTKEVSRLFARAYRFLRAAREIADNIAEINKQAMNFSAVNQLTRELEKELFEDFSPKEGYQMPKERHLFSCAYTPEGFIDFTDTILQGIEKVFYLHGDIGTGKSKLLKKIAEEAGERGLDIEIYHTPLIPQKIGTVVIKDLRAAITSSSQFQNANYKTIDLQGCLNKSILASFAEDLLKDRQLLEDLIAKGIQQISKAKAEHDILEQYYVVNMNFTAINEKQEEIISRILSLCEDRIKAAATLRYN